MYMDLTPRQLSREVLIRVRHLVQDAGGHGIEVVDVCAGQNSVGTKRLVVFVTNQVTKAIWKQLQEDIEQRYAIWTEVRSNAVNL